MARKCRNQIFNIQFYPTVSETKQLGQEKPKVRQAPRLSIDKQGGCRTFSY